MRDIPLKTRLRLLRGILRIRRVQERIHDRYLENDMHTPVHLCIGQEAIAVGVCATLRTDDVISSNHRGHGHYLAKGGNLDAMIAELHGRATGCSHGYGGSMHLVAPEAGHLGSSSIVGGGIPIGTGHALAFALRGEPRVSVVFLGDGASEEGVFYESCNFAMLRRLPVVYVLENNGWAVCSPTARRERGPNVFHVGARPEDLFTRRGQGNDVEEVYTLAAEAVERARIGKGPAFLEFATYRMGGHAGCAAQDTKGYRSPDEVAAWAERCPLHTYTAQLLRSGDVDEEILTTWEDEIAREISRAFDAALTAPFPGPLHETSRLFASDRHALVEDFQW